MNRMGDYPPGVTGAMIDNIDPVEIPRRCENCTFYEETTCGFICGLKEAEYTAEQLEKLTDSEYMERFGKKPDDYCHDHEFWED